jgi:hypothetical protein
VLDSPHVRDLPAPDLEARQRDLDERQLIVEAALGVPMSIADRMIAEATAKQRYEERFPGASVA